MKINKDFINNIGKDKLIIMAIAGIVLVICSYMDFDKKNSNTNITEKEACTQLSSNEDYVIELEKRVEEIISQVDGVSKCKVMITLKSGSEKILKNDTDSSMRTQSGDNAGSESSISEKTLILQGENREEPYVIKEVMPEIEGVVILAKGASDTKVVQRITNMIKALFSVESHKISIVEMK